MSEEIAPLTDEERAELEALRAEKAARERAELEALRRESARPAQPAQPARQAQPKPAPAPRSAASPRSESEEDRRIREARERGAKLMEPDDDLSMPLGQKIVLAVIALLVALIVGMHFLVG